MKGVMTMSSPNWTDEQQAAISASQGNLLVSAAAGAGKTAVLVERVIRQVLEGLRQSTSISFLLLLLPKRRPPKCASVSALLWLRL